jgi:hypothetical protein
VTTDVAGTVAGVSSWIRAAAWGISKRLVFESAAKHITTGKGTGGQALSVTWTCCCTNSSNEWNVQLKGACHRRTSARATANKEWDSSFALSLCSVGNKALYTVDQMIRRSDTLYSRRAITTRANTMTTMVHSIVHSND